MSSQPQSPPDPTDLIDEYEELFERLADSNLEAAPYFEKALDYRDEEGGDDVSR
jgi:hypothetical protein